MFALIGCDGGGDKAEPHQLDPSDRLQPGCNGSELLCTRRFDEVAYASAHNAMSNEEEGWIAPNQYFPIQTQLEDGIRNLMLDTHYYGETPHLCHGSCQFGRKPLADGLMEIKSFMDANPHEVISIFFERYISVNDTVAVFADTGLVDYVYAHEESSPWPTLGDMVESGLRLVVFDQDTGGEPPWYHYIWDFIWDTDWANKRPEDFDCSLRRGNSSNSLFSINHFLTNPLANPSLAEHVNHNPFFLERVEGCMNETGQLPNFISVDFYSIGDVFEVVDTLNGL